MRSMRTPGGSRSDLLMRSTSASTPRRVGRVSAPRRISTMPCTMSSLSSWPATPSRGSWPTVTVATSDTSTGEPSRTAIMVWPMSSIERICPTERITADCGPRFTVLAPTLLLAPFSASSACFSVRP